MIQNSKFKIRNSSAGVVVLPAVIVFSVVALGIVATGLFVSQLVNRSTFGARLAEEAELAAQSSLADIHLRLIRNNLPPSVVCNDANPVFTDYGEAVSGRVTVSTGVCHYNCDLSVCRHRARAEARSVFLISRKLEAVFDESAVGGQVSLSKLELLKF